MLLISFWLSGAAGLIYENVWLKSLSTVFGGTAPATTFVLTVFMGGLMAGSCLYPALRARLGHPLKVYGCSNWESSSAAPPMARH